jgi:hypothetical protein
VHNGHPRCEWMPDWHQLQASRRVIP